LPLASSPRPAPSGARLWASLAGLEPGTDLFGLLKILRAGSPEEEASEDSPDGDRHTELCGDAEDTVFHRGIAFKKKIF
jgi:hypothetical protein